MPFTPFTVDTTVKIIAPYNPARESLLVFNNGTGNITVSQDQANVNANGIPVPAGASIIFRKLDGDPVEQTYYATTAAGTQDVRVYEGFPQK